MDMDALWILPGERASHADDERHSARRSLANATQPLAPDRVTLHAARIGSSLQDAVAVARSCAKPAERPPLTDVHRVAALAQLREHVVAEAGLNLDLLRPGIPRVEGAREVVRVEG